MLKLRQWSVRIGIAGLAASSLVAGLNASVSGATTTTTTPSTTAVPTVKNLLNNGNFALPFGFSAYGYRPPGFYTYNKEKVSFIPGWTVGAVTDPDLKNSAGPPDYEGGVQVYSRGYVVSPPGTNQEVMMDYYGPGSISQAVTTIPGLSYELSWFGAGYPGEPTGKTFNVMWDDKLVAAPVYSNAGTSTADVQWKLDHVVVLASSTSSLLTFAYDPPCQGNVCGDTVYGTMVSEVTLNADAQLYLPPSITLAPTGKLLAVVRSTNGTAFTDPNVTVTLVGSWQNKVASYAPPVVVTKQLAVASVVNSVASLQLQGVPVPGAGKTLTITATATMTGPGFVTQVKTLKIHIS
ncbi:MAG: hypothetical protein ACLQVK_24210 [Acidimicrobiales bacterium]